jgi:hypothetical protein
MTVAPGAQRVSTIAGPAEGKVPVARARVARKTQPTTQAVKVAAAKFKVDLSELEMVCSFMRQRRC